MLIARMGAGIDIDLKQLGLWLEAHVAGFYGLTAVTKYSGGQSNPTYRLDAQSGTYVLRAKPAGVLLPSAHQVGREYRVMAALAGSTVPVPRMLAFADDDTSPIGRAFFVMSHVEGRIFWDPALPDLAPAARRAIYHAMAAMLADLHTLSPEALGLADFGRAANYFARQVDRWGRQYQASAPQPHRAMQRLGDWLAAHLPPDDGEVALVHGDYRLDNMIFAQDAPTPIALLDWELSTLGHPLADLAYQCMQLRLPHNAAMRGLGGVDRAPLGIPSEVDYVAFYCARRGIAEIPHWPFYLAFSFFRLAAILQGVVRRADDGNASNPDSARAYAPVIPVLAGMALDLTGVRVE